MPLSDDTKQKFFSFLAARAATPGPCPLCKAGAWAIGDSIWELREFTDGTLTLGGPIFPVVPLVCTNCGNTLLINAVIAGLVQPRKKKENAAQPATKAEDSRSDTREEVGHDTH